MRLTRSACFQATKEAKAGRGPEGTWKPGDDARDCSFALTCHKDAHVNSARTRAHLFSIVGVSARTGELTSSRDVSETSSITGRSRQTAARVVIRPLPRGGTRSWPRQASSSSWRLGAKDSTIFGSQNSHADVRCVFAERALPKLIERSFPISDYSSVASVSVKLRTAGRCSGLPVESVAGHAGLVTVRAASLPPHPPAAAAASHSRQVFLDMRRVGQKIYQQVWIKLCADRHLQSWSKDNLVGLKPCVGQCSVTMC